MLVVKLVADPYSDWFSCVAITYFLVVNGSDWFSCNIFLPILPSCSNLWICNSCCSSICLDNPFAVFCWPYWSFTLFLHKSNSLLFFIVDCEQWLWKEMILFNILVYIWMGKSSLLELCDVKFFERKEDAGIFF